MSLSGNFKEDLTKIRGFVFDVDGVLSSSKLFLHPSGEFMRSINTRDGYIMQYAITKGYPIGIITGGNSSSIRERFLDLGLDHIYMASKDKLEDFKHFLSETGLYADEILYMGDDINDLEAMKAAGMATCPSDAVPEIKSISKYISTYNGGEACVRDVIEQVLRVQDKWL